ncbi:hypothetical protein HZP65_16095 [Elizabethkingia anophelis]|nr:hypothetical protein [Elizabethkingia anophelis]MCT4142255.1 hypothetical protein [Elizabethkingia anophelis]MCT4277685.1 hypothetical protein [Elizabethkingia anophelis]MCT4281099.1 hypothetical protein [Elizabethkingia anophelis]
MKKLSILLFAIPSLYFAQLATPQGQIQTSTNPETGNIGIGTTTPDQKLVVNFNNEPKEIKFFQPALSGNPVSKLASSLMFTWYNENTDIGMIRGETTDILGLGFRFNGQEKMRLASNGNLGIGTTTPQAKLDIRADENLPIIRGNGGYIPTGLRFVDDSYNQSGQVKEWSILKGNSWTKGLAFTRYDAVNACKGGICDVSLYLHDNGNIGINTVTPEARLHIAGAHGDTTFLMKSTGNNSNAPAYLNLWASEPGMTYTGTGIGNNIKHWDLASQTAFTRYNSLRGGSYMRLLENQILFTTVDGSGKSVQALNIAAEGNVAVTNKLEAKEIKVTSTPTADFVFEDTYQLPDLASVEKHIKEKKHLPEIASAAEMQKEGVNIGDFQIKLLQKIEELTLYSIEQNKQNKELFRLVEKQQEQIKNLEKNIQQSTNTK